MTSEISCDTLGQYNKAFSSDEVPDTKVETNNSQPFENVVLGVERDTVGHELYNQSSRRNTNGLRSLLSSISNHLDEKFKTSSPIDGKLNITMNNNPRDNLNCDPKAQNHEDKSHLSANMINTLHRGTNKIDECPSILFAHTNQGLDLTSEECQSVTTSNDDPIPPQKYPPEKYPVAIIYDKNPKLWTQVVGAIFSATVHLAVGCVVGFTGVTLPSLMDPESGDVVLDKSQASIFSSIVNIGAIAGSVLSSLMMTYLGQRSTLLVYLPIGMLFWVIMSFARSVWLLILCRIIQGIVIGVCAGCANNYVVETAHTSVRGRLVASIDLSRQIGFLFMYLVGSSELSWRNVGLVCGLVSMALPFIGMVFLPHSPRWLSMHGRSEEARKSLLFFRGEAFDVDSELSNIQVQLQKTSKGVSVFSQLKMLTERSIAIRFFVLAILLFASHFTGNFALIAYSVSIFESAEVQMNPYLSTVIVACVRILGVGVYMTIADKFGRRPLLMIPLFLSGISMVALGLFFFVKTMTGDTSAISWLPLTSIMFYVLFTMMSHPVIMLLRSELLPTSVRSVGVGLLYLSFFCGSFGVSISYPYMVDSVGSHWTFWLYGATSFGMVIITAIAIPETQGISLEDIGELFERKKKKNEP